MNERAFPTEADRRQLIAVRASALRRLVEPLTMHSDEQKVRLVQELMRLAQDSDSFALPLPERVRTELDTQIAEPDPAISGELRARVLDLADILAARHWPLPWYAVASHPIDEADRSGIAALVEAYAAAAAARDEVAAIALYALDGEALEMARRWFRRHVVDVQARVERLAGCSITPRFDTRRALLGSPDAPPLRLRWTTREGLDKAIAVGLSVVRSTRGWQLG